MALAFRGREFGIKDTSTSANVPESPKARLMYYLGCVNGVSKHFDSNIDANQVSFPHSFTEIVKLSLKEKFYCCFASIFTGWGNLHKTELLSLL